MNADRFLLDTSALLTLIEDEPGAERVEQVLSQGQVWLPWLVPLEATYITRQEQGEAEAEQRYAMIKQLPVIILWEMNEPTLLIAARLKADYRLSLADAIIAAFAVQQNAVLLHKDPEFEAIAAQVSLETLPYKTA